MIAGTSLLIIGINITILERLSKSKGERENNNDLKLVSESKVCRNPKVKAIESTSLAIIETKVTTSL